jgi:hypothetical protein
MALSKAQATIILRNLGWRVRTTSEYTTCIRNFQAAWNLGAALAVDGKKGPKTDAALLLSESRRRAGKPTASANFGFLEVRCRCGGKYSSCQRIFIKREALQMAEKYRAKSGRPLTVVSACRCPSHNKAVGGSTTSRHPKGLAMDVPARYSPSTVKSWRVAKQIGYSPSLNKVCHIDMGAGYTVLNPRIFKDGR